LEGKFGTLNKQGNGLEEEEEGGGGGEWGAQIIHVESIRTVSTSQDTTLI
jgi:hypothetical protein